MAEYSPYLIDTLNRHIDLSTTKLYPVFFSQKPASTLEFLISTISSRLETIIPAIFTLVSKRCLPTSMYSGPNLDLFNSVKIPPILVINWVSTIAMR